MYACCGSVRMLMHTSWMLPDFDVFLKEKWLSCSKSRRSKGKMPKMPMGRHLSRSKVLENCVFIEVPSYSLHLPDCRLVFASLTPLIHLLFFLILLPFTSIPDKLCLAMMGRKNLVIFIHYVWFIWVPRIYTWKKNENVYSFFTCFLTSK